MTDPKTYALLAKPNIRLTGHVDYDMYDSFREQLAACPETGPLALAMTTLGGDPEVARTIGDDIRLLREHDNREILFLGKVAVYSAGAVVMSSFPIENRYFTSDTRLMIHERSIDKTVEVQGPLRTCVASVKAVLHQIEHSILIEEEGFRAIVAGSKVDFETVREKAPENWYLNCKEALKLGLIADVI